MTAQLVKLQAAPDLVDQVYRALLHAISEGSLAPGARITQEDLAEKLAVSRQPVLQALRLLKKDGFVLDAPGRGVLVAPLDAELTLKVYQVRGALDALAARLAAQARFVIAPRLIDQGRKAARGRNIQAMIDADLAFHSAIYAASGNPLIEQSAQLHWAHLRRVMGAVLQSTGLRDAVWDEHEQIAAAIAAGNEKLAVELIDQHSQQAGQTLAARLSTVLKRTAGDTP
ncbi:MAG: GntR family transcriptional regulator [Methylibium sp. NZG]|nr:MAG: GntR family transcriptional regulator [Methylibium sp. NZG]